MPEFVLTILKYLFLSLIFLFLARAVRAMYLEVAGSRAPRRQARPAAPAAAPAAGRAPDKVAVILPDGSRPAVYSLDDELMIGRSSKCQVVLSDTYVSQVHARIFRKEDAYYIEDLGSTNGTYLNRRKVTGPTPVSRGDRARVGKTELEFRR